MTVNMKELIYTKFLELMKKKNIDKITVKDLAEACNISRQTFYYHFQDIPEVVEYLFVKLAEVDKERSAKANSLKEMLEILLDVSAEQEQILNQLLHSKWRNETIDIVRDIVMSGMKRMFQEKKWFPELKQKDVDIAITFYTYAIAGVMIDYKDRKDYEPKKVADDLYRLITGQVLGTEVNV